MQSPNLPKILTLQRIPYNFVITGEYKKDVTNIFSPDQLFEAFHGFDILGKAIAQRGIKVILTTIQAIDDGL